MKILYHHRTLSKDGQDVHIREMITALRRRGHEVVIAEPATTESSSFGSDGGFLSRLRAGLPRWVSELLELVYSLVAYRRLRRVWLVEKPDLLYERYNLFLLAGVRLKKRFDVPFLLEVNAPLVHERERHGGLSLRGLARWAERRVWRSADHVLPVTDVLAGHVSRGGVDGTRIRVIPNGVDRSRFTPDLDGSAFRAELGLDKRLVLGFTGFVRPWHGLGRVLDMMAANRNAADLHFLVLGDGPGLPELRETARELGMSDRLTLHGLVERDRIASCVAAFDIALQPAVVDYASPLKLFEYMALGKAIVAPDQPNIREVLRHEDNALLFLEGDDESFKNALDRLCHDSALRRALGAGARRTIEVGDYTWDGNARRVEELAAALLVRRQSRA